MLANWGWWLPPINKPQEVCVHISFSHRGTQEVKYSTAIQLHVVLKY